MTDEQLWSLACTSCCHGIKMPVKWFKEGGNVCPHCGHPVDPQRIEKMLSEVKQHLANLKMDDDEDIEFNF